MGWGKVRGRRDEVTDRQKRKKKKKKKARMWAKDERGEGKTS